MATSNTNDEGLRVLVFGELRHCPPIERAVT